MLRYLGVQKDLKPSFIDHITKIENNLSRFCGCNTGSGKS